MTAALATATDSRFDDVFGPSRATGRVYHVNDVEAHALAKLTARETAAGDRLTVTFCKPSKDHHGATVIAIDGKPWGFVSYRVDTPSGLYLAADHGIDLDDPGAKELLDAVRAMLPKLATGTARESQIRLFLSHPVKRKGS